MSIVHEQAEEIKKITDASKSVFILLPQNPSLDATAAALALYLSLREAKKNVNVGSPSPMQVEYSKLVGIDRITDKIGNRNLIISFDYKEDSIEKVSYNVEGEKFNLVIQPRAGYPPLDQKNVSFSYEGITAEAMLVVGSQRLENLGDFYDKNRQAFSESTIINIDRNASNTKYGQINLVDPKAGSISEMAFAFVKSASLPFNQDIASNLLKGIEAQTNNFQAPFTSPETFETVAELLRTGARRSPATSPAFPRPWTGPTNLPAMDRPQAGYMGQIQYPSHTPPTSPTLSYSEPRLQVEYPKPLAQQPVGRTDSLPIAPVSTDRGQYQEKAANVPQPVVTGQSENNQKLEDLNSSTTSHQPGFSQKKYYKKVRDHKSNEEWLKPKIYQGKTKVD